RPGELVTVSVGGEATFLAPLPASLLTPDPDVRARLGRFGLKRIGQVAALAGSALVARFGEEGARVGMRARGEETDPFRPRRPPALHGPRLAGRLARLALTSGEGRVARFEITEPEAPRSERRWSWEPFPGAR